MGDSVPIGDDDRSQATGEQCDEMTILQLTNDLLQLCRSTQMAYLSDEEDAQKTEEPHVADEGADVPVATCG